MNKIRKWLIHKLGGVAEISPLPYKRYITYNFTPVKFGYSRIVPEHIPPDIIKEEIAICLAKEMLDKGFIKVESTELEPSWDSPLGCRSNSIEYKAEVYASKREII